MIEIDAGGKTSEEVLRQAFMGCYDIMKDDANFRNDPTQFENLRNHYPVRREFEAYKIRLANPFKEVSDVLKKLGFSVSN